MVDIPRMAEKTTDMIKRSLEAFAERDANTAKSICDDDDEVDKLYDQVYRELLTFMIEDPRTITRATYLMWVAHNLERIADRVTNICERIVFLVTGTMEEVGRRVQILETAAQKHLPKRRVVVILDRLIVKGRGCPLSAPRPGCRL